jgi:hypothetical protein
MGDYSFLLFARPSFIEGAARIFDFGNSLTEYNYSENGEQADALALRADYEAIAGDMRKAFSTGPVGRKLGKQ